MTAFPKTGSEPLPGGHPAEPSPWGPIVDVFGFAGAVLAIPVAILAVGIPIALAVRLVLWLAGQA